MFKKYLIMSVFVASTLAFAAGCSSTVEEHSESFTTVAKQFNAPPAGWAGVYIYRIQEFYGQNKTKDLYIDGQYIGKSANGSFFYRLVKPGIHKITTESEYGENDATFFFKEGENKFLRQNLKFSLTAALIDPTGMTSSGADVYEVSESEGKQECASLVLAKDQDDQSKDLEDAEYGESKGSVPAASMINQ